MPSPFPGMDPYLEGEKHWPAFQHHLVACLYQTLLPGSEVFYQMSQFYEASAAGGVRWNDPLLAIRWPEPVTVISERDGTYPDLQPGRLEEILA